MSQSSHDEAVDAFLAAAEPITVEVLRRKPQQQQQQQQQQQPNSSSSRAGSESRHSSKRSSVAVSDSLSNNPSIAIQTDVVLGGNDALENGAAGSSATGSRPGSSSADVLGFIPDLDYEVSIKCPPN